MDIWIEIMSSALLYFHGLLPTQTHQQSYYAHQYIALN